MGKLQINADKCSYYFIHWQVKFCLILKFTAASSILGPCSWNLNDLARGAVATGEIEVKGRAEAGKPPSTLSANKGKQELCNISGIDEFGCWSLQLIKRKAKLWATPREDSGDFCLLCVINTIVLLKTAGMWTELSSCSSFSAVLETRNAFWNYV